MSGTDSVVLTKPLPDYLIGKGLGQFKLEFELLNGIFIRKNLYYILTTDNQVVIKASWIDSSRLNHGLFKILLNGNPITIKRINFNVDWKFLNINLVKSDIKVYG